MRWSDERILTTHTGSLPRPPELTRLYVRRARGEAVDAERSRGSARRPSAQIVAKQIEAGVDIGNNGEQQREAFFLYVRHRMTGFGGSWKRWPRGDVERYPILKAADGGDAGGARGGRQLRAAARDRRRALCRRQPS